MAWLLGLALADTTPDLTVSRSEARRLECERMSMREGARRFPGRLVVSENRAADPDVEVVVCAERIARPGLRDPGSEALLHTLSAAASELAVAAAAGWPELADRTWLVEPYHADPVVGEKVAFAVKNALMTQGVAVSDRTPLLAAGDVDVLTRLPPLEAYPAACARYAAGGSLGPGDVLLGVMQIDPRETAMHAGACVDGSWLWLR